MEKESGESSSPLTLSKPDVKQQFADVLAEAVKHYSNASRKGKHSSLDDFLNPPVQSVDDLLQQINLQNENLDHFRAKRKGICDAVSNTLLPVQVISENLSDTIGYAFPPSNLIFGATLYLIKAAHDVSFMYESIIRLFGKLKDFTARLDVYIKYTMTPALRDKVIAILAVLFEVLLISTDTAHQGRFRAYLHALLPFEKPVERAMSRLDALTLSEEREVIAETYGGVNQVNDKADNIKEMVSEVSQSIQEMKLERRNVKAQNYRDKLKDMLRPSPFPKDFQIAYQKDMVPGTGDWLLQDETLQAWVRGEVQHLWMSGNPGTGKSFLSSKLITWGAENLPHIAYFFFRDNDPETRSVLQALYDVAYQLAETDAYYADKLMQQLHSSEDIKTLSSAWRRLFIHPFADDPRPRSSLFVILDGVDDTSQEELMELLSLVAPADNGSSSIADQRIQLFLAGRPYLSEAIVYALDPKLEGLTLAALQVTQDRISADVRAFIKDGVRHSRVLSRSTDQFKMEVAEAMNKRADGLFIVAKFLLTEVDRMRHPKSILQSLDTIPKEFNGLLNKTITELATTLSADELKEIREMLQWVTCAEETLTLEQVEAALALVFGDPPLQLEGEIRGSYACFFELKRDDGLTTDDLIKRFGKKQRESTISERSEGRMMSPSQRLYSPTSSDADSPSRRVSFSPNRSMSPAIESLSPSRQPSPTPSPIPFRMSQDKEFRSPPDTKIMFAHPAVRQFFREGACSNNGDHDRVAAISFDIVAARVHILKICLKIFMDKAWFEKFNIEHGKEAIKQYAAWYWQEHFAALDPATVSASDRRDLGMQIYKMLTSHDILFDWSIMYEKNNEGSQILTDSNIAGLQKWLCDPEIQEGLSPEAKLWSIKAKEGPMGIYEPIGRAYAKAWLSQDAQEYVPTLFCFEIIQNVALMSAGHVWSQMSAVCKKIPIEERMSKIIEWTKCSMTAYSHMRIGSTLLMLGKYDNALTHYNVALDLEHDNVEIIGRIAFCQSKFGRYKEALEQALKCSKIEEQTLKDGKLQGHALRSCQWRLYKEYFLIAKCYHRSGEMDSARSYFSKAIESAAKLQLDSSEDLEAETRYIKMLAADNSDDDIMKLLNDMAVQTADVRYGTSRLCHLLLLQYNKPLVMEWIPKAACKSGKVDWILAQLETAIEVAHKKRDPTAELYLQMALGTTCAYNHNINGAIAMFENICLEEYKPRGNIPTRQGQAIAYQKLATLYKVKVLHHGIQSPGAQDWISKMDVIREKQNQHRNLDMPIDMLGSDVNIASIYLAMIYHAMGKDTEANTLLGKLIVANLNILADEEPRNDGYALENLVKAFIAANDTPNAIALARSMRRVNPKAGLPAPDISPIQTRADSKLPVIQSVTRSCNHCLNNIMPCDTFVLCRLCLDSYCQKCLDGVIKGPGNKTSDARDDVCCRSDHEWFTVPPLDQHMRRGEILFGDGKVQGFAEWVAVLKQRWGGVAPEDSQTSTSSTPSFWLT